MSTEANKGTYRRFMDEVAGKGNLAAASDLMAADYVHHDPNMPPELQRDRESYVGHFPMYRTAFPDFAMTMHDVVGEGDRVAGRWSFCGTHQGDLMGIPPTGHKVDVGGITIYRFANGKIVEGWTNFDMLGLMQQLGMAPSAG